MPFQKLLRDNTFFTEPKHMDDTDDTDGTRPTAPDEQWNHVSMTMLRQDSTPLRPLPRSLVQTGSLHESMSGNKLRLPHDVARSPADHPRCFAHGPRPLRNPSCDPTSWEAFLTSPNKTQVSSSSTKRHRGSKTAYSPLPCPSPHR